LVWTPPSPKKKQGSGLFNPKFLMLSLVSGECGR
jgi:hypothetical protein